MAKTEEATETKRGGRSQMHVHTAMVEWLESEKGYDFDKAEPAEVIAAAFAHRVAWRQTEEYHEAKNSERERREAEKKEKAEARAKAAAERKQKQEEEKAAKAEKSASKEKDAPAAKATRKGRRKNKGKDAEAESTEEDPFE